MTTQPMASISLFDSLCDELCSHILSFLSLKDKVRCERVCKQFQRCVYVNVIELDITENMINQMSRQCISGAVYFDTLMMAMLAKKCHCVHRINCFDVSLVDSSYKNRTTGRLVKAVDVLAKYLPKLREIYWPKMISIKPSRQKYLYTRYGPLFRWCECIDDQVFKYCPNLESLDTVSTYAMFSDNQLVAKNLKRLCCGTDAFELNHWQRIINENKSSLKELHIYMYSMESKTIVGILQEITKLEEMRFLQIGLKFTETLDFDSMAAVLTEMSVKCLKLKQLLFTPIDGVKDLYDNNVHHFNTLVNTLTTNVQIFNALKSFEQLTHLFLNIPLPQNHMKLTPTKHEISLGVQPLNNCWKYLTQLSIHLLAFVDIILESIDTNWPKLQHLVIVDPKGRIDGLCMESIARLRHLQSLDIATIEKNRISDRDIQLVMERCPRINRICVHYLGDSSTDWQPVIALTKTDRHIFEFKKSLKY